MNCSVLLLYYSIIITRNIIVLDDALHVGLVPVTEKHGAQAALIKFWTIISSFCNINERPYTSSDMNEKCGL